MAAGWQQSCDHADLSCLLNRSLTCAWRRNANGCRCYLFGTHANAQLLANTVVCCFAMHHPTLHWTVNAGHRPAATSPPPGSLPS